MTSIVLITHRADAEVFPDDAAAAAALRAAGHAVHELPWTAVADWPVYDLVVMRTCYGYHAEAASFSAWLRARANDGTRLANSAQLILQNIDKTYLRRLQDAGFAGVPTVYLRRGEQVDLAALLKAQSWVDAVVKPTISAGAAHTFRTDVSGAQARLHTLLTTHDVMVQPLVTELLTAGEWSLIFIEGVLSHVVLKHPAQGDFRVQPAHGGRVHAAVAPPEAYSYAQRLIASLGETPLYARVDGVVTTGGFWLMELELIEPYLFLNLDPAALQRYVDAVVKRAMV